METISWDGSSVDRIHSMRIGGPEPYFFRLHGHAGFWEMTVVLRGKLEQLLDGAWCEQRPGMMTLFRPGEAHAIRGQDMEFLSLAFDLGFVARLDPDLVATMSLPGWYVAQLDASALRQVAEDGEVIRLGHGLKRSAALLRILGQVAVAGLAARDQRSRLPGWLEKLARQFAGTAPIPDLETLQRDCGVSAAHLARTVRAHFGCTPGQWLHRLRLARAADEISRSVEPLRAIAKRHGYPDAQRFHRCFSAIYGLGPQAWRKREQGFVR